MLWERYGIGEELKINDPVTRSPARRNVFWKARDGASPDEASTKLDTLRQRGLISLVCNISVGSWSSRIAERMHRDVEEVRTEVRANLVTGAILVPSGIYALIRAQNGGCAYMTGT